MHRVEAGLAISAMVLALTGLLIGVVLFIATGGHLVFLPLLFVLPLGGGLLQRRSR